MNAPVRFQHPGFTLALHLFRQFLVENDKTTEDAAKATVKEFFYWLKERAVQNIALPFPLFPDAEELLETYDITDNDIMELSEQLDEPFEACSRLYRWWPMLCMSGRRPLKRKITGVTLGVNIEYDDGINANMYFPTREQSEPFTDGMIAVLWRHKTDEIIDLLSDVGSDEIYDWAKHKERLAEMEKGSG